MPPARRISKLEEKAMIMMYGLLIVALILGSVMARDPDSIWDLERFSARLQGIEVYPTERWYRRTQRGGVLLIITSIGLLIFCVYVNIAGIPFDL
jgi:hypothetical protein